MSRLSKFLSIPWKRLAILAVLLALSCVGYLLWSPGDRQTDGRYDRGSNGIWLQHGWIGDDAWFARYDKNDRKPDFRDEEKLRALAQTLRAHHITELFPHLAPCSPSGALLEPDHEQLELFLQVLDQERVMPWIGGVYQRDVRPDDPAWRHTFIEDTRALLSRHPSLAGVHLNVEPWPSGEPDMLVFLDELKQSLPEGKLLSLAAYPPPVPVIGNLEVHWSPGYISEVAHRVDQMVFMNYDSGLKARKLYVALQRHWIEQELAAVGQTQTLIGLPAYDDFGVPWHDPRVENLESALDGLNAAMLSAPGNHSNYAGVAIYSDWEMTSDEWALFEGRFNTGERVSAD